MRIMFAVPSYWPSQDGVSHITGYLAQGLAERGHVVFVLTSMGNGGLQELPEYEAHEGVQITRMRIYTRWPLRIYGRDERSTSDAYRKYIREFNPDILVIVCSQTWTLDWIKQDLDKLHCKKIFYSHGYSLWKEKYPYGEKLRARNFWGVWELYRCKKYYDTLYKYIQKFDRAIYLSEQSNSYAYAVKYHLQNGKVLENAIDDRFFADEMRDRYATANRDEIKYLFVANYTENKNQEMLIEAYGAAKIGKSQLILVGFEENNYYYSLEEKRKRILQGQDQKEIALYTHLSREQVIDLYRSCDIFVCSSKSETWSIVAHEAAAAAMPIISTNVGVYCDIPKACIVENVEQMTDKMEHLYYDGESRKRYGEAAYEWIIKKGCRINDKIDWLEAEMKAL